LKVRVENANCGAATARRNAFRCSCCATWHGWEDAGSAACVRGTFFYWNIRWLAVGLSTSLFGRKRDVDFRNRLAFGVFRSRKFYPRVSPMERDKSANRTGQSTAIN
jgi:hypothetical protein